MEHYFFAHGKEKKLKFSIIRPFNVYGPGQNPIFVVSNTLSKIMKGEKPEIYDGGNQSRCFTYVDDIVSAAIKISNSNKTNGKAYNVARNKSYSIKKTISICKKLLNSKVNLKNKYQIKIRKIISRCLQKRSKCRKIKERFKLASHG